MADHIRLEVEGGVATLTIDRPEKRNAMTWAMLGDFHAALERADADAAARVLIITGSGGSFCAGTDLSDLSTVPGEDHSSRGGGAGAGDREAGAWWPITACRMPVIGAIDGAAVGMGAEFTSQCDVRIATDRARFAWNFAHRGLVPDTGAGSWLLPRLIGPSRALRLLYSGEFLLAEQALEIGYVADVVAPENLQAAAREEAERFLRGSPLSHRLIKRLVYEGLERDLGEHMTQHRAALETCFRSADHKEGVASFLERREARFTGR